MIWGVVIAGLISAAVVWWAVASGERRARERRRRIAERAFGGESATAGVPEHERYAVPTEGERVPIREENSRSSPESDEDWSLDTEPLRPGTRLIDLLREELEEEAAEEEERAAEAPRVVVTPDGPMELTRPPFVAAGALFDGAEASVLDDLRSRLPAGYALAVGVRLDALLEPTRPADGSIESWRKWRDRVRKRRVSAVVCRDGTWVPVLVVDVVGELRPTQIAGGRDRIVSEVLRAVGIPLVEVERSLETQWTSIAELLGADGADAESWVRRGGARRRGARGRVGPDSAEALFRLIGDDEPEPADERDRSSSGGHGPVRGEEAV